MKECLTIMRRGGCVHIREGAQKGQQIPTQRRRRRRKSKREQERAGEEKREEERTKKREKARKRESENERERESEKEEARLDEHVVCCHNMLFSAASISKARVRRKKRVPASR